MGSSDEDSEPDFSFLGNSSGNAGSEETPDFGGLGAVPDTSEPDFAGGVKKESGPGESFDSVAAPSVQDEPSAPPVTNIQEKPKKAKKSPPATEGDREKRPSTVETPPEATVPETDTPAATVPQKFFVVVAGYAIAITLLLLALLVTGRITISPIHPLESLPDIKPIPTGEFREFSTDGSFGSMASLPEQHELQIGQTQRYGDVEVTAVKVTREQLWAELPDSRKEDEQRTESPVLLLWLEFKNVSESAEFAPWDAHLMCYRFPEYDEGEQTRANSWLLVKDDASKETRVLNYLHTVNGPWQLTRQNSGTTLKPGEKMLSYVASAEAVRMIPRDSIDELQWRVQFRKGIGPAGHGVTTLIDVSFSADDIQDKS